MDRICKCFRLLQVRLGGLTPEQIRIWCVCEAARDGSFEAASNLEETLHRTLARHERPVACINIASEQFGTVSVRAREQKCWDTHYVGRQSGRGECRNHRLRWHQHLAAHVATLLLR